MTDSLSCRYFVQVTEYEKKIANGTYNPDLDGVLKLEY